MKTIYSRWVRGCARVDVDDRHDGSIIPTSTSKGRPLGHLGGMVQRVRYISAEYIVRAQNALCVMRFQWARSLSSNTHQLGARLTNPAAVSSNRFPGQKPISRFSNNTAAALPSTTARRRS